MTRRTSERRIRRIVVALGREGLHDPALEAVAELAENTGAEIAGLFVEDVNLLRLAELPFARELTRFATAQRRLQGTEIERQLRIQALAAERALGAAAERAGVPWSFRVARGLVAATLLEAVMEADLLALGAARRSLLGQGEHLAVVEELAARLRHQHRPEARPTPAAPVVVVFSRAAAAQRALRIAARAARANRRPLMVFVLAGTGETAERLRQRAGEVLGEQPAHYRRLIRPRISDLIEAVRTEGASMLVLDASKTVLEESAIRALHERLSCPVLLVR